jgi:hypothetical protein
MSIFDEIRSKAEEMLGGTAEDVGGQITDITEHIQNTKEDILSGGEEQNSAE